MVFDHQGKPIIGFDDSNALPIIGHTPTGDTIYGTLHSETSSQPGTNVFLQAPSVDLDGVPLEPTLLKEKPLDSLTPLHDHQGDTYRKTPGPVGMTIPVMDDLMCLMDGLLRLSQVLVDQSVTTTKCLDEVSQSLPSCNSCPDHISPPQLSSSTSVDAFALQHHILALEMYFHNVLLLWSPGNAKSAWKVSVANMSISQMGGQLTTWLELYGK